MERDGTDLNKVRPARYPVRLAGALMRGIMMHLSARLFSQSSLRKRAWTRWHLAEKERVRETNESYAHSYVCIVFHGI